MPPAYTFTLVRFTNAEPLILLPDAYQCRSEISPLAASENFTQRRRRRIGAGSPYSNDTVNGATVTLYKDVKLLHDPYN